VASDPFDSAELIVWPAESTRGSNSIVNFKTYHPELSSSQERNKLLDRLIELNLQSDTRFAEMLIRSRLFRAVRVDGVLSKSLRNMRLMLRDVSHHFDDAEGSESERCVAALEKWMRSKKDPTRDKALRFLASRGFNFSDATEAVNAIFR
jgi:regulatory protein